MYTYTIIKEGKVYSITEVRGLPAPVTMPQKTYRSLRQQLEAEDWMLKENKRY